MHSIITCNFNWRIQPNSYSAPRAKVFCKLSLLGCAAWIGAFGVMPATAQDKSRQSAPIVKTAPAAVNFDILELETTSLKFANSDVSFYQAGFQLDKQWKQFLAGPFIQHLKNSDIGKKTVDAIKQQWENREGQIGQARSTLSNPNLQSLLGVLQDLVDDDFFMLADADLPIAILQITELTHKIQVLAAQQDLDLLSDYLQSLDKSTIDAIPVPTVVMGGKISDKSAVLQKLDELEAILTFGLGSVPLAAQVLDGLERIEDEHGTRIALTLKPSMVPWQAIPTNGDVQLEDNIAKIQELLEDRQISIVIGMLDDYLVFSVAASPESIASLGAGESLLGIKEMALVKQHAKEPLLSIAYASDELASINFKVNLDNYFARNGQPLVAQWQQQMSDSLVEGDDDDAQIDRYEAQMEIAEDLPEDLTWLDDQIGQHVPEFKGSVQVSIAMKDGVEAWGQNRTRNVIWQAEATLPVLKHLGQSPIAFAAGRRQYHPEYFETAREIVRKVRTYLERMADTKALNEKDTEKLNEFLEEVWPLLVKTADVIEEKILPATKDGQFAFVLSPSHVSAKQYGNSMPTSETPLPLIEWAKIVGVTDSDMLIEGLGNIYEIADQAVEVAKEAEPEKIPEDYTVPRPEEQVDSMGKVYYYPIPEDKNLPEQLRPQALFAPKFAYFAYSTPQVSELSKESDLKVRSEFIADAKKINGVAYLNGSQFWSLAMPWIKYAIYQQTDEVVFPAAQGFPELRQSDLIDLVTALTKTGEFIMVETENEDGGSSTHARYFQLSK